MSTALASWVSSSTKAAQARSKKATKTRAVRQAKRRRLNRAQQPAGRAHRRSKSRSLDTPLSDQTNEVEGAQLRYTACLQACKPLRGPWWPPHYTPAQAQARPDNGAGFGHTYKPGACYSLQVFLRFCAVPSVHAVKSGRWCESCPVAAHRLEPPFLPTFFCSDGCLLLSLDY